VSLIYSPSASGGAADLFPSIPPESLLAEAVAVVGAGVMKAEVGCFFCCFFLVVVVVAVSFGLHTVSLRKVFNDDRVLGCSITCSTVN
jgi:hypothetical protein